MKARSLLAMLALVMVSTYLPASEIDEYDEQMSTHEATGFGIGAVIGAIIAGPPGAVLGGMTGNIAGANLDAEETLHDLDKAYSELKGVAETLRLDKLALVSDLETHKQELQHIKTLLEQPLKLPGGFSLSVNFRHGSSSLEQVFVDQLVEIAKTFSGFDGLIIKLAGHADRSGSDDYNESLSTRRVYSVARALCKAGWPKERMQVTAHGESRPLSKLEDTDGYDFDRRVRVHLISGG